MDDNSGLYWIAGGLILMVLELAAPGVFLVWFALAAIVTGLLLLAVPLTLNATVLVFSITAIIAVLIGRKVYGRGNVEHTDTERLNAGPHGVIGQNFLLDEPLVNGMGRLRIDDTLWRIASDQDLAAGTRVTVTKVEGSVLRVKPV
jgi:membrane protein implicated in regulation of membrane protease activity